MTFRQPFATKGKRIAAPSASKSGSTDGEPPAFCLRYVAPAYSLAKCTAEEKGGFADALANLSKMTWLQIKNAHKHGLGTEKIDRSAIKTAIPPVITEDNGILALRFHGKAPMVGFRSGRLFHIVWFDRDFSLYDHD